MSYYRSVLFIGLLAASVFVVCSVEPRTLHAEAINLSHQNERPVTIPAIREWRSTAGWFLLNSNSRIVVSSSAPFELKRTATIFASELRSISGQAVAVIVLQNPIPRKGDILLAIALENQTLGDEGYNISIGLYIAIRAPKSAGVFYGTRTVLQIIRQSASGKGMPKGDIRDWPQYQERGLMIDIARKYFTPQWLQRRVLDLAYLKMNYLHLHISDNEGFGIESRHPGFCQPEGGVLKKSEVENLIKMAQRNYITVVPEIDMPGHMGAILCDNRYARFRLQGLFGIPNDHVLDITRKKARDFAKDLIREYSELFRSVKYWHMGADEVFLFPWDALLYPSFENHAKEKYGPTASTKDTINDFVNEIDTFFHSSKYMLHTLRVWNDQVGDGVPKSAIAKDVTVDWWTDFSLLSQPWNPTQIVRDGHQIMNHGWWPTYYVTGGFHPPNPDMGTAYESWSVQQFRGNRYFLPTAPLIHTHCRPTKNG
jgi:hexosaminidase